MTATRVAWGFDAHRFASPDAEAGPLKLAGVVVDGDAGVEATSDGDVLAHAVADAIIGVTGHGDLGTFFPSSDPKWQDADSMDMVRTVVAELHNAGLVVSWLDVTVVAETVRVAPYRGRIASGLAAALEVSPALVSVKATSTDGMGFVGAAQGIAAVAVLTATER